MSREVHVWCSLCFIAGKQEPATVDWDGQPSCRAHFIACGGVEESPVGAAYAALHPTAQLRQQFASIDRIWDEVKHGRRPQHP